MSRAEYYSGPVAAHPDAVEVRVHSVPDDPPAPAFDLTEEDAGRADLEVEIPGAGMIRRANVTPFRAVLIVADGRAVAGGPRPVFVETREPEEMRAAARVLTLAAQEMETLRATRADVRNRERRYQPGRQRLGTHGGA